MDLEELVNKAEKLRVEKLTALTNIKYENLQEQLKYIGRIDKEYNFLNQEIKSRIDKIQKNIENVYKVYYIESPNSQDNIENRTEGKSLTNYFDLSQIKYESFFIKTRTDLVDCFEQIAEDIKKIKKDNSSNQILTPIIHFSAHGNDSILALTNDKLTWSELGNELRILNAKSGINLKEKISDLVISLSVCEGINLKEAITFNGIDTPFISLIAPTKRIDWDDALTGFQVFYHQFISKSKTYKEAFEIMVKSSDYDYFEILTDVRIRIKQ